MNSQGRTTIKGNATSDLCATDASDLILNIYNYSKSKDWRFLDKHFDQFRKNWTSKWSFGAHQKDGFQCDFFVPKKNGDDAHCPPALVFRGSDSGPEDFAELCLYFQFKGYVDIDMPFPIPNQSHQFQYANSFSPSSKMTGKNITELRVSGFSEERLFVNQPIDQKFPIVVKYYPDADVRIHGRFSVSLFYGKNGDWPNNISQGLGQKSTQYESAMKYGKLAAQQANKGLIVTGHSLGGGLASAAAIAARVERPDLSIKCTTYNAAGLHKNTIKPLSASLSTAAKVPVKSKYIKGEILTSLQKGGLVPIIGDILRWAGKSMPEAVVTPPLGYNGISPGILPFSKKTLAQDGRHLPKTWPVDLNRRYPVTRLGLGFLETFSRAKNPNQFAGLLLRFLINEIFSQNNDLTKAEAEELQTIIPQIQRNNSIGLIKKRLSASILKDLPPPKIHLDGTQHASFVEGRLNTLISDLVMISRVLMMSVDYHMYQVCVRTMLE